MLRHRLPSLPPSLEAKPALSPSPPCSCTRVEQYPFFATTQKIEKSAPSRREERKGRTREVKRRRSPIHPWLNNLSFQTDSTSTFLPLLPPLRVLPNPPVASSSTCLPPKTPSISPSLFPALPLFLLSHFYLRSPGTDRSNGRVKRAENKGSPPPSSRQGKGWVFGRKLGR